MNLDIFFRRMPSSAALHRYARARLQNWETEWARPLDLRLIFAQEFDHVSLELCGRDAAGHAITAFSRGVDVFAAFDALYRELRPQGRLLTPLRQHPQRLRPQTL